MSSSLNDDERCIDRATMEAGLALILGKHHPVVQLWAKQTAEYAKDLAAEAAKYEEDEVEHVNDWKPPASWLFDHMIRNTWAEYLSDQERMVLGMKIIGDVHDVELHLKHEA